MTTYKDGLRAIIERAMWASGPIIEALGDIERLESENATLNEQLAAANKRADAAVKDMHGVDKCDCCKTMPAQNCTMTKGNKNHSREDINAINVILVLGKETISSGAANKKEKSDECKSGHRTTYKRNAALHRA